jgi:UDP-GlcNAc:undecaprenyl-phosphate GlcNAc-1-phosphate transferase
MILLSELLLTGIMSFIIAFLLIPFFKKIAILIGLVDKPNYRKIHVKPVPLVGGIAIVISSMLALFLCNILITDSVETLLTLIMGMVLMITGSIDDKMDIKPFYRLLIQFGCSYTIALIGIRLTSLYGVFGIHEISIFWQYFLTITIITGVVNAFNLMDGIDGLAGGLAIVGLSIFSILSYMLSDFVNLMLFVSLIGSTLTFLKFNLSKNKVFLGDGGSLFLGFVLVVSGINIIEKSNNIVPFNQSLILVAVIGVFLFPVLDSLRVYVSRIMKGLSPFKADKSHIHHLFLLLNINHRQTTSLIIFMALLLLILFVVLINFMSLTLVLIFGSLTFFIFTTVLNINKNVKYWTGQITRMENE